MVLVCAIFKCQICKMRNAAGLFMIIEPDKAVLLCARRAYRSANAPAADINDTFLEKFPYHEVIAIVATQKFTKQPCASLWKKLAGFLTARSSTSFHLRYNGKTTVSLTSI